MSEIEKMEEMDRYAKARKLLSGARGGWTVDIVRKKPRWCKGYCERVDVNPDELLDFDEIRDDWGGKTFLLSLHDDKNVYRGWATVDFPEEPRKQGRPLNHSSDDDSQSNKSTEMERLMNSVMTSNKQMMDTLVTLMTSQQSQNETRILTKLTEMTEINQQEEQPTGDFDQLDKLTDALDKFEHIRERLGGSEGAGSSILDTTIQKGIEGAMDIMMAEKKAQLELQKAQMQAKIRQPLPDRQVTQIQTPQKQEILPAQPLPERKIPEEENKPDLDLNPAIQQIMTQFANTPGGSEPNIAALALGLRDKLSKMPPEEAEQTILGVLEMAGFKFGDDDENKDDNENKDNNDNT